jgi:hypothetical protein
LHSVLQENRLFLEKKFIIPVPYLDTP